MDATLGEEPDRSFRGSLDAENLRALGVEKQLDRAAAELARGFAGTFTYEVVRRCVGESYELLAARARVQDHLLVLAARFARERLQAAARNPVTAPQRLPDPDSAEGSAAAPDLVAALQAAAAFWARR